MPLLIKQGRVAAVVTAAHAPRAGEEMIDEPAGFDPAQMAAYRFEAGALTGPGVFPDVEAKRQAAQDVLKRMTAWIAEFEATIIGPVSPAEQLSWTDKEIDARAFQAGTAAPAQTAALQVEADLTGETLEVLAAKIITRADALRPLARAVAGLRRKGEYAIMAEAAKPDPDPAQYEAILADTKALFEALPGQMGGSGA